MNQEKQNNLAVVADVEFDIEIQVGDNTETLQSSCYGRELHSHIPYLVHHLWNDQFSQGKTDVWCHISVTPIENNRTIQTKLAECK